MNKISSDERVELNELVRSRNRNVHLLRGLNKAWEKLYKMRNKMHAISNKGTPEANAIKDVMVIIEAAIAAAEGE